jgi:ABC-type transport system involved in multi-copper enzyme maturation permease subunit
VTPAPHAPPARRRLDAFETVYQTARFSLRRSFRGGRFLAVLLLVLFPLALSIPVNRNATPSSREELFYGVLGFYHFGLAVPAVALAFATAFPWPEAEEGSLTWWFTAPVRRWAIHLGRFAAAALVGSLVLPLSVLALALPLDCPPAARLPDVATSAVGATLLVYPAYLGVFWLVSTVLRRGLAIGVLYIVVENTLSLVQGNLSLLTMIHWVRSLVHPAVPETSRFRAEAFLQQIEPSTAATSVGVFVSTAIAALVLSLLLVETVEYRGKTAQPN